jgi:hypothetical protein
MVFTGFLGVSVGFKPARSQREQRKMPPEELLLRTD